MNSLVRLEQNDVKQSDCPVCMPTKLNGTRSS